MNPLMIHPMYIKRINFMEEKIWYNLNYAMNIAPVVGNMVNQKIINYVYLV